LSTFTDSWLKDILGESKRYQEEQEEIVARTMGFMYMLDSLKTGEKSVKGKERLMAELSSNAKTGNLFYYRCN
jgi:hypothetical protein